MHSINCKEMMTMYNHNTGKMKLEIRPIEEKDYEQIIVLFREFALFEKRLERMTNSAEQLKQDNDLFNCYVATIGDEIVGYATYFFAYYSWTGKSLYLEDLYVTEAYRKQGIGKKLLYSVINFAKNNACKKMRWQVANWNKNAQEFYKYIGAEIDDVELNCDLKLM